MRLRADAPRHRNLADKRRLPLFLESARAHLADSRKKTTSDYRHKQTIFVRLTNKKAEAKAKLATTKDPAAANQGVQAVKMRDTIVSTAQITSELGASTT